MNLMRFIGGCLIACLLLALTIRFVSGGSRHRAPDEPFNDQALVDSPELNEALGKVVADDAPVDAKNSARAPAAETTPARLRGKDDLSDWHDIKAKSPSEAVLFVRSVVLDANANGARRMALLTAFQGDADAKPEMLLSLASELFARKPSPELAEWAVDTLLNSAGSDVDANRIRAVAAGANVDLELKDFILARCEHYVRDCRADSGH